MIAPARIHVRFSDLDVLGHVNNSIYLSYFEIARVHYFNQLLGTTWNWKKFGLVLAKNEVEYVKPILLNHEPNVKMSVDHIGTKSFSLSYEILVNDIIHSRGSSLLVCYNAIKSETIPIPEVMREALLNFKKEQ